MKLLKMSFCLVVICFSGCNNDDDLEPNTNNYVVYAKQLALREIIQNNDSLKDSVEIPLTYYKPILDALWSVHTIYNIHAIDSLHIYPFRPQIYRIIVYVNSLKAWVNPWENGHASGDSLIDELMDIYDLKVTSHTIVTGTTSHIVSVTAKNGLNVYALSQKFEVIDGVVFSEPDGIKGDGNDIKLVRSSEYLELIYSYGFGDCLSGCTRRHFWTFRVFNNDSVQYMGESGDPLPPGNLIN